MVTSRPTLPALGYRVPDLPHAVSVQLPKWQDMIGFAHGDPRVTSVQKSGYPRSFLHEDVKRVHAFCAARFGTAPGQTCMLYCAPEHAAACKSYLCDPPRSSDEPLDPATVVVKALRFDVAHAFGTGSGDSEAAITPVTLHAVLLPEKHFGRALIFWRLAGCGISSRLAEDLLPHMAATAREEAPGETHLASWPTSRGAVQADLEVRQRVAELLERAARGGPRTPAVSSDDVSLYATGMSAIYHVTRALQNWRPESQAVVFGFPYELTLKMQQDYARAGCVFYGRGTDEELDQFEDFAESQARLGRPLQAVWCECASNPLLRCVDLERVRRLADRLGFPVVLDDTIGTSANIDVLPVADIVVTSLTKSFNGFADVMAGSVAMNPRSRFYGELRAAVAAVTAPTPAKPCGGGLYGADTVKLAANSRGQVLPRVARMNATAAALVALLTPFARDPAYALAHVYYPSTCAWSAVNYRARMRLPTPELEPGYGGLFTIEFANVAASAAFFDALRVHKGPSLGAHVTLAQPYVQTVFKYEKPWAASYGLSETIVRISVGIEDPALLAELFLEAVAHVRVDSPAEVLDEAEAAATTKTEQSSKLVDASVA